MRTFLMCLLVLLVNGCWELQAENLPLERFLDLVKANNKDLQLAAKDMEYADAQKKEALATALPKIQSTAGYTRNLSDYFMYADMSKLFGEEGGGIAKFKVNFNNEYDFSTSLIQTLYSAQVGNALKASRQYERLVDFSFDARQEAIRSFAKKAFYQTLLLKKVIDVDIASSESAQENYVTMQDKFKNGLVSELDLLQAEVRWKNTIPEVEQAKRNYNLAVNNLKILAGIPFETVIEPEGELNVIPDMPDPEEVESVLKNRPDYNVLLWQKELRTTSLAAERGERYPSLQGFVSYNFSSSNNKWQLGNRNNVYVAGLNLTIPIYTGGYTGAQIQKAAIELDKSEIEINKKKDEIYLDLKNIELRLKEAHDRIASAEAVLRAAEKAFSISEITTTNGLTTQLDLKQTRVAFDQATLNYYNAIFEYYAAYFDWELAVGNVR